MKYLLSIIFIFTLSIFQLLAKDVPTLSGTIKGYGNDSIVIFCVSIPSGTIQSMDTLRAKKGYFEFNLASTEATECAIYSSSSYVLRTNGKRYLPETAIIKLIVLPGSKLNITGSTSKLSVDYLIRGNSLNETLSRRRSEQLALKTYFSRQDLKLDSMAFKKVDRKLLDQIDKELTQAKNKLLVSDIQYVRAHPDQDLSAYYLTSMAQDSFLQYVTTLKPSVLEGVFKQKLAILTANYQSVRAIQNAQKMVTVGTVAPDFTLKLFNGDSVSLRSISGKYVVLDFWGSWCHWCIQSFPKMKEYYQKYKASVDFVGINVRDSESEWKSAVTKYGLPWIQLRNLTDTDVPAQYGVSGYPTRFVLDKDQKILARIVGEDPAFYKLLDDLLSGR
jgi:thiol-disulfide isomerase/thioredoxin